MCHRQRCGVIQKCSECKLSVCKNCAFADRLGDDGRHVLDANAVEWDSQKLPKGRRVRAARGAAARGGRARGQHRGSPRGSKQGDDRPRPASSHETSSSLSATASPQTDKASVAADDRWVEDDDWAAAEQGLSSRGAPSPHDRPMKRSRAAAASPVSSMATLQAEDVAQILAGMPHNAEGSSKSHKYDLPCLWNNLQLRAAESDAQQCSLPPLNSLLLPPSDVGVTPRRPPPPPPPPPRSILPPLQSASVAFVGHTPPTKHESPQPSAGHGPMGASLRLQPTRWQYPYPVQPPSYPYDDGEGAGPRRPLLASPPAQQPSSDAYAAAPAHYGDGAAYVANARRQHRRGYGNRASAALGHPQPLAYRAGPPPTGPESGPVNHSPPAHPMPPQASRPDGLSRAPSPPSAQATVLKDAARQIKQSEYPDWPLVYCLRLAVQRSWSLATTRHAAGAHRQEAIEQLVSDTHRATCDLELPQSFNAATDWVRQEARRLAGHGLAPSTKLPVSGYLSGPHPDARP